MELRAKDIAEIMGVSASTVSLVINNRKGVGEKKRREILEKIRELNCEYMLKPEVLREDGKPLDGQTQTETPDLDEKSIVCKGTVGFVVFKRFGKIVEESPFFNYFLEGINHKLRQNQYNMSFGYMDIGMSRQEQEDYLKGMNCCGLILFGVEMIYEDLAVFKESGLPFVLLDNAFKENDVDAVAINNVQGVRSAVRHLVGNGHRKIGYIRCKSRIGSFEERFLVFQTILKEMGIPFSESDIVDVDYSETGARQGIKDYLKNNAEWPTAFFAENDFLGCGALRGMLEMGIRVPEEISVVGFDNRPITQMIHPNLTTVNVPKDIFGPVTVNLLLERLEGGRTHSIKMEIGTNLVERESVKRLDNPHKE